MGPHTSVGSLTVCRGVDLIQLDEGALIGRLNWITAYPSDRSDFFATVPDRTPVLILHEHAAITSRHIIDCTATIVIGRFSTVAGYRSQLVTHTINLAESRQDAVPIRIGEYCFVGTNCVILGGSILPDYSVLAANAVLNEPLPDGFVLYGGVPARAVRALSKDLGYFQRRSGVVN